MFDLVYEAVQSEDIESAYDYLDQYSNSDQELIIEYAESANSLEEFYRLILKV